MKERQNTNNNKKFKEILAEFFPTLPIDLKHYDALELQLNRHVLEITLTRAEILLFEKGFADGELILDDPAINLSGNNILRSEILNWYLSLPSKYIFLFRRGYIKITHAVVMTMSQYWDFQTSGSIVEGSDVVDISHRSLKMNIEFSGCHFKGSINIQNSQFESLIFERCIIGKGKAHPEPFDGSSIYPSIYANKAKFHGDFRLRGVEESSSKDYKSDFGGPIVLTNAVVEKTFSLESIQTSHDIVCYFSRFGTINAWNTKMMFAEMMFTHAEAKEMYIQHCFLFGTLNDGVDDHKKVAVDFFSFKADRFCVRGGTTILGGFSAMSMKISGVIDLSEAVFISRLKAGMSDDPNNDETINLSNSQGNIFYLQKGFVSLGKAVVENISAHSVFLNRARFVNFDRNVYGKALVMTGSHVTNFIDFKPQEISVKSNLFTVEKNITEHLNGLIPVLPSTLTSFPHIKRCIEHCLLSTGLFSKLEEIENKIVPKIVTGLDHEKLKSWQNNRIIDWSQRKFNTKIKKSQLRRLRTFRALRNERKRVMFVKQYSIFIGEADLSSILVNKKLDFAGALFYGREHNKLSKCYEKQTDHNAVNIKYAHIDGDLFINDCDNLEYVPPFKAIGEVDLHSAIVHQFFINPLRGRDGDTDWRATGFKYEYIYSGGSRNARSLDSCNWFKDYTSQDNYLQPYQQLAAAFDRLGDDTRAKRILIMARLRIASKSPIRNLPQLLLYTIISVIASLGMPANRAMLMIILLFCIGAWGIDLYIDRGAFHYSGTTNNVVTANEYLYSLENMVPFNLSMHEAFTPNYETQAGNAAASFLVWHKLLSTLFLALLLIGISKITKGDK